MIVLGLDQAPVGIGWAYGEPGNRPAFGYHANPSYGDNTVRLRRHVREWLTGFIRAHRIERVYYEQILVRNHGFDMTVFRRQTAVADAIETACDLSDLLDDCFEVIIADWRTEFYAGGRPRNINSEGWKAMAPAECARRGWLTDNHNIAEALGIWHYGCYCTDRRYRVQADVHRRRAQLQQERGQL